MFHFKRLFLQLALLGLNSGDKTPYILGTSILLCPAAQEHLSDSWNVGWTPLEDSDAFGGLAGMSETEASKV